jgi:hydroxymethylglutaryl-CoA lyase
MDKTVGFRTRAEAPINGRTLREGHPEFARPGLAARKAQLGEAPDQKLPADWDAEAQVPPHVLAKRA